MTTNGRCNVGAVVGQSAQRQLDEALYPTHCWEPPFFDLIFGSLEHDSATMDHAFHEPKPTKENP